MASNKINTYDTKAFRDRFFKPEQEVGALVNWDYSKFFIVKVEEMLRLIQLPVPPARSTTHTLIYLTSGEARMSIGSMPYRIQKDECLFVPAGQVFSFDNPDVNKGFLCNFHDDFAAGKLGLAEMLNGFEFLHVWGNHRIVLDKATAKHVHQLLKRIYRHYATSGLQNLTVIQANFIALLCELNGVYRPLSNSTNVQSLVLANKFKEQLFQNIKMRHLVSDYASALHVSPNHLNKAVKQITGKSPSKWIDEALVLEAKVLLNQTNLSISEIAAEIGILDPSYFSRLFKKYAGETPLAFRNRIETS